MAGSSASRVLLASVDSVWQFLAEPYHLSDWWPGLRGVEPDRRGFEVGARWAVQIAEPPLFLPRSGRDALGRTVPATLEITTIEPKSCWAFRIVRSRRGRTTSTEVRVNLTPVGESETSVTVEQSGRKGDAAVAVERLHQLIQVAAAL